MELHCNITNPKSKFSWFVLHLIDFFLRNELVWSSPICGWMMSWRINVKLVSSIWLAQNYLSGLQGNQDILTGHKEKEHIWRGQFEGNQFYIQWVYAGSILYSIYNTGFPMLRQSTGGKSLIWVLLVATRRIVHPPAHQQQQSNTTGMD